MTYERLARSFAALGEPNRQWIVERLADAPASVGELAECLPISRPAVSQHLKALKEAGIDVDRVNKVREGRPHIVDAIKNGQVQLIIKPRKVARRFPTRPRSDSRRCRPK